jgi:two-component system, NarL family, sensor histidine kinase BarA
MVNRRISRAVGATSLEIKCLFLFGVFLLVVMAFSLYFYWWVTREAVREQQPVMADGLVDHFMLQIHWKGLDTFAEQAWKNEANKLRKEFADTLSNNNVKATFLYRPDAPLNPDSNVGRPADKNEADIIDRFMRLQAEGKELPGYLDASSPDKDEYYYYQPICAKQYCTTLCHLQLPPGEEFAAALGPTGVSENPLAVGDLMAVAKISVSNETLREDVTKAWTFLLAVAIVTAFMAMVAFYIVIRYVIVRPVRHLRDVSDAIAHGDINMRADIRTGDEFEALAVAYNRMLRHLVDAQDELRGANVNLDVKVDELAKLNMQLYETNRVKSDFMATMSHELRTPLNSILGFSDVLGSIDSLDSKQQRFVQNIQKSGRLLLEMINNVLDLAKVESGKMELRLTSFDVRRVIGAQCDMARPLSEKKNIDLIEEIQPDLPPMHQDQGRIQQVLNNLLSNAIKFTPEGGRIKVVAQRGGEGGLVIQVIDTGVGIAEEDQQAIFEKFRQGTTSMPGGDAMTREYGGSGLGLSICRELCNLLGGEVTVQSELGTGSTFTVRLPWQIEQKPILDSPLTADFEEFSKSSRFDRARLGAVDSPTPANDQTTANDPK